MGRALPTFVMALAAALAPTATAAQSCGITPGVAVTGAFVSHRVGGGVTGPAVGADLAFSAAPARVRLGYRHTRFAGDAADPHTVRVEVAYPAARMGALALCAVGHGGGTVFTLGDDAGLVLAGGLGVTLASDAGAYRPFVSVRGLAARTTGTVLGIGVDATGLSLGVEAGAAASFGALDVRLTGALDGFDNGLGVTPYPAYSVELAFHYRL